MQGRRRRRADSIVHEPYLGYSLSRQFLVRPSSRSLGAPLPPIESRSEAGRGSNIDRKTPVGAPDIRADLNEFSTDRTMIAVARDISWTRNEMMNN